MSIRSKLSRPMAVVFQGAASCLLVFGVALIAGMALFFLWLLIHTLRGWSGSNWLQSVSQVVLCVLVLASSPLVALKFFQDRPRARRVAQWYQPRVLALLQLGLAVLLPAGILAACVVGIELLVGFVWGLLWYFGGWQLSTPAAQYTVATLVVLVFTLVGHGATRGMARRIDASWNMARWLYFLRPSLMRVYVYALLAVAYFLATLEKFSPPLVLLSGDRWADFKGVILEVLLTYAAIDGVFSAWRDHREASRGESFWKLFFPKDRNGVTARK